MNAAAIAQHLNIAKSLIKSVEEWANVLYVRFVSGRPRFVSKKVAKVKISLEQAQKIIGDDEAIERGYVTENVIQVASEMAAELKSAGFKPHNGQSMFFVNEAITAKYESRVQRKQWNALDELTAYLMQ